MANYYEKARTNYFKVRDAAAFDKFIALFNRSIEVVPHETEGTLALLFDEETGIPITYYDHEAEDWVDVDFMDMVSQHLTEDSIAVIEGVGSEKMRYLVGYAIAINSKGQRVDINIAEIYERTKEKFGVKEISTASH